MLSPEMNSLAPWEGDSPGLAERSVKSAERTLALFELFSLCQRPLTIGQIADTMNIPQPSVTMLVRNLVRIGYLEHDRADRTYLPTIRIMLLGSWVHQRFNFESNLEARLDALMKRCDETVLLGLQNRLYCQYVCAQLPDRPNRLEIQTGMLRPLTRTAIGRVLLSAKSDSEISLIVRRCNAEFPSLALGLSEFMKIIEKVRSDGFAETNGDMTEGHGVIAVAIPTPVGNIPMAAGVGGEISRVNGKRALIVKALRDLRDDLSASLEEKNPRFEAA